MGEEGMEWLEGEQVGLQEPAELEVQVEGVTSRGLTVTDGDITATFLWGEIQHDEAVIDLEDDVPDQYQVGDFVLIWVEEDKAADLGFL